MVLFAVGCCLVALATGAEISESSGANRRLLEYDRHFSGDPAGWPDGTDYVKNRLVPYGSPGIVLAVLTVLVGLVFCVCRCCVCSFCPEPLVAVASTCCGVRDVSHGGFTAKERRVPKLVLVAMFLLVTGACVVGWIGNRGVAHEFTEIIDDLQGAIDSLTDKGNYIADSMWSQAELVTNQVDKAQLRSSSLKIRDQCRSLKETPEESKRSVKHMARLRTMVLNISFAVAIGLILMGLLGALTNKPFLAMTMCILAFVCLTFAWAGLGVHLGLAVFLDDTCYEIDLYVSDPNQRVSQSMQRFIKCPETPEFKEGYDTVFRTMQNTTAVLNDDDTGLQSLNLPTIAPQISEPVFTKYKYHEQYQAVDSFHNRLNTTKQYLTTMRDAPSTPSSVKDQCDLNLKLVEQLRTLSNTTESIGFFDSCYFIKFFMSRVYQAFCDDLLGHFHFVYAAYGVIAIFMVVVVVIGSRSSNMWDTDNWEENCGVPQSAHVYQDDGFYATGDDDQHVENEGLLAQEKAAEAAVETDRAKANKMLADRKARLDDTDVDSENNAVTAEDHGKMA